MSNIDLLVTFWETAKEYIPIKDRQAAADHIVNELIDMGIDDEDLEALAIDKAMLNAVKEHIDIKDKDDDEGD
jgi:hypothetical protein